MFDLPEPLAPIRTVAGVRSVNTISASDRKPRMRSDSIIGATGFTVTVRPDWEPDTPARIWQPGSHGVELWMEG